jgi:hypothetical protein
MWMAFVIFLLYAIREFISYTQSSATDKQTLCHCEQPDSQSPFQCQELEIPSRAAQNHLDEHEADYLGQCEPSTPSPSSSASPTPTSTPVPSPSSTPSISPTPTSTSTPLPTQSPSPSPSGEASASSSPTPGLTEAGPPHRDDETPAPYIGEPSYGPK